MKDLRAQFGKTATAYVSSEVRRRLRGASSAARDAFHITETTFAVPKVVLLGRR